MGLVEVPPPPVNRQTPVKTVPSRRTTYVGGNKSTGSRTKLAYIILFSHWNLICSRTLVLESSPSQAPSLYSLNSCLMKQLRLNNEWSYFLELWIDSPEINDKQESPARKRKRRTVRLHRSCLWRVLPGGTGGYLVLVGGKGYPCPRTWLGYPLPLARTRTGVPLPPGKDLGLETSEQGYLPQRGPGTRGWEGTWDQRQGYPPPPPPPRTDTCENITFRRTTYAGIN